MRSSSLLLLVYDGPAVEEHKRPVETLAQSLTALNRLASTINKTLFNDKSMVSLSVTTFKKGSFGVELVLDSTAVQAIIDVLSGKTTTAAVNALAIIGCLIEYLKLRKWIGGREITRIENFPDKEQVKIYVHNESIIINNSTYAVYQNPTAKRDSEEFVKPLSEQGFTDINLSDTKNVFHLNEKELGQFVSEPKEQVMTENHVRVLVQVDAPNFKQDWKWRVSYNGQSIMVTVLDERFLARVERHEETFGAGDILDCELTIKQVLKDGNIAPMYELTEVKEHRFPPY